MTTQQITSAQVSGGTGGGGTFQTFSATPGSGTTFTITASGTVRDGVIAFATTADSLYISCSFCFGNLATGSSQTCFGYLSNNGGGTSKIVKVVRNSAGTVLTVSWSDETDRPLLAGGGLVSLGSLINFSGMKYVATVRTS